METSGFNPKREARPSQTTVVGAKELKAAAFQSQTGSQALSDAQKWEMFQEYYYEFQSQTGSQALSDSDTERRPDGLTLWFQSQTGSQALSDSDTERRPDGLTLWFQSQTGSQALSDFRQPYNAPLFYCRFNPKREARPSQTRSAQAVQSRSG